MKKTLLFIAGAILSSTSFSQVMDQPNVTIGTADNLTSINDEYEVLQSFKAGKSGLLDRVELNIGTTLQGKIVKVQIFSGTFEGANLNPVALGSKSMTIVPNSVSTTFSFTGIELNANSSYSIKISTTSTSTLNIKGNRKSPYTNGNMSIISIFDETVTPDFEGDINFATYVTEATGVTSVFNSNGISIYPNPGTTNEVSFSQTLTNITVLNSLGAVVLENASADYLNISTLENGFYIIKSEQGTLKFEVSK
jgi:hypothetical protein